MPGSVDQENDQSMMDAGPEQQYEQEDVLELEDKRIVVLPGATETAASFQFDGEGHTLGNALRYTIMKNPQVEFCGYTIPHPSETKMNLRIQTFDTTTAVEALEKGLDTLMDLCDVVTDKFTVARDGFNASKTDRMES
ncbi:DNA-directed RNA polymerase core subunit RPC19 [Aspergillus saccharolyticus JOP 1030-1]|uniref:DNA-directed RNA polymerase I and III 14 kDa polypeptide n=1 Tax=Aspergillus saccharolyticus JOP 1030-1 TaxID=1450539 RepID=A0A318ZKY6_9EURO|nr:DNA-directed RNA polymerase I and III 14 KDA polypeptide [Aspergillus saccharolyticus JOP 1030-1]PYH48239.1 DNA-directed RNA polymerase I and III 14 KDA polypeptide [Aspergillus saccharolyticus JOP 1030-1]